MKVFRIPFSTNVERIELAVGHKGIEVDWVGVDPDDRSPVEQASGQSRVPVLVADDGEVVADSPLILDWLEAHFPDPPLYPTEPARRAEVRVFAGWFNRVWKRLPNEIEAQLLDAEPDPTTSIPILAAGLRDALDLFEALLSGREYLYGEFGLADVTAFPFLKYPVLGLVPGDDQLFHRILVDYQPLAADSPLHAWVARRVLGGM